MKRLGLIAVTALITTAAMAADDWYPSRYGADDTIGAANNLTAEGTKAAAGLVTEGKVYALGVVTGPATPAYAPRWFKMVITQSNDGTGPVVGENRVTANDDLLVSFLGVGTQIDGLGHLGIAHRYYNGNKAEDFVSPDGIKKFGTESIPPIATRGVLLDMTKQFGVSPVAPGTAFNRAEIDAAASAAGVTIQSGDVVLFHTGHLAVAATDPAAFVATQPGLGKEGAEYLSSLGVVAIGADTAALEAIPFEKPNEPFVVHQTLLAKNGVYILENINTADLAADGATTFLFVLGQPRFQGAVQMVINPVAIR
ncbi:MAG: cyclase family protein [Alphaproteobacteria bacterium]|nr:cyclase family protein [Alphaproteobacteria bacterium]